MGSEKASSGVRNHEDLLEWVLKESNTTFSSGNSELLRSCLWRHTVTLQLMDKSFSAKKKHVLLLNEKLTVSTPTGILNSIFLVFFIIILKTHWCTSDPALLKKTGQKAKKTIGRIAATKKAKYASIGGTGYPLWPTSSYQLKSVLTHKSLAQTELPWAWILTKEPTVEQQYQGVLQIPEYICKLSFLSAHTILPEDLYHTHPAKHRLLLPFTIIASPFQSIERKLSNLLTGNLYLMVNILPFQARSCCVWCIYRCACLCLYVCRANP